MIFVVSWSSGVLHLYIIFACLCGSATPLEEECPLDCLLLFRRWRRLACFQPFYPDEVSVSFLGPNGNHCLHVVCGLSNIECCDHYQYLFVIFSDQGSDVLCC